MPALSDIGLRLPAAYARALKLSLFFCDQHVRCATDVHGRGTNNLKIPMSIFRQNEFRKLLADYFRVNRDIFQRIQCWCLDKYFWCRTGEWLLHHVDHASARARRQSPKVLERSGKRQFNILINFAVIGISAISLSAQTKIESCGLQDSRLVQLPSFAGLLQRPGRVPSRETKNGLPLRHCGTLERVG